MKSIIIVLLGCLIAEVKLDYSRSNYGRSNYYDSNDSISNSQSHNNRMNVKTSYSKTKTANGRVHNFGGCIEKPPNLMNAGMKCSQYSGCKAQCIPNHQFPNGQIEIRLKCAEGKWQIDGADLDYDNVPSCEPMCSPGCQNNGICVAPNQCNCPENFAGPQCQFENKPCLNYPPMSLNAKRTCRSSVCTITCLPGHKFPDGSGISTMTCEGGSWRPSREGWVSMPDCMPTCNPPCLNGGNCLSFNVCQCPQEFRGPQCQYDVDACNAKKLSFNGGYNCSGSADSFSCSLSCPPGIDFEFPPARIYSCTYVTGAFFPSNIPQCLYSDNMEVIPMGGTSHYHTTFYNSSSSSSSGSHSSGGHHGGTWTATTSTSDGESNSAYPNTNENSPAIFGGMDQNQYVVVEDKKPSPGVCFTWSGTHYRTFDGKIYSFQSDCPHVMVRDTRDDMFSIVVGNNDECKKEKDKCYRVIKVYVGDKEYILKKTDQGIPVLTSPQKTWPIPGQLPGIRAEILAHYVVLSLDTVGAKIKWDTEKLVQIEVTESLWNRTAGLCGNIDGDIRNDIVTKDGAVPKNVFTLASSWQNDPIGEECATVSDQEHGCDASGDLLLTTAAHDFCSQMLSDPRFHQCLEVMDIRQLLEACKWDFCVCTNEKDPRDCACNTINVYVRGCAHSGIKSLANWRSKDTCPMECTGGRVYMQCAPSKGQAVCGASVLEAPSDGSSATLCDEGCYCPIGTVLHENICITREKCPCRLRGKDFPAGTSLPKDCNTCNCASGQWICTQVSCGARCAAIGDPHYVTFDGKRFDFMGQCSYYLVKHDNFTIEAENVACSGAISQAMNFPVNVVAGLPSCTKTLTLKMSGQTIHLKQNHELVVNGRDIIKIPHEIADIKIRKVSSIFLQVELPNAVLIWWDGISRAYIDVPASFKQQTKGLCGTFNENQKDDFLTPDNDIEQSVIPFANKWKTEEKCNDIPDRLLSHPCNVNVQNKATAESHCQKLKSDLFADCHWFVDPEAFYQDCLYDMCSCETKVSSCLCPILSAYAQSCSTHSIQVNWRPSVRECGIQCPRGQTYQVCGDSCARSCRDLSTRPECRNKRSQCVEGCNCPTGETLDEFGECIPVGRCDCWHEGLLFPAGYKEVRAASKGPELCICVNANWNCKLANDAEKQKYPNASDLKDKCDSSKNFEFTTCESIEPVTCKNMHSHEPVSPVVCHAGCQCKEGHVLDTKNKRCVKPTECPCQHGGKSYKEKSIVQSDCNTCACKNGKWDCTDRQCSAECTAWGDSHFKTFDGKMFDYQGQCDYVLAKGVLSDDNSFDISIQNVPCSSLGVACSKSVTIKIGSSVQQESITLTREMKVPTVKIFNRFTVRSRDLFVILEAFDFGLIVMWDKGTRVYVKIDPRWKNKVKGLCGNYNDNEMDDFQTPSGGFVEASAQLFGDSWKLQAYCPEAVQITDTCAERPDRKLWALKKCGALKSYPFALCHSEVNVEPYIERCIFDSCACDQGGDCECLCTALAAYAQECNNRGVPIKWRSQHLCPIQCDERCSTYSPCISTCPPSTCDNLLSPTPLSRLCAQDTCVEGCEPKPCPSGHVYTNASLADCVPASSCRPICMEIDDEVYYEGDLIEEDDCHRCYCSRGQKSCKGQPCPEVVPTTPSSAQGDDLLQCKSGWTEWINQDTFGAPSNGHKTEIKLSDKEPVPDQLLMNSLKGAHCSFEKMTQIKCRSVGKHIHYKEAHDNVECSLESGLICTGSESNPCPDFEISIKCACDADVTLIVPTPLTTPATPSLYEDCDDKVEYMEHPTDCSLFYHCDPTETGHKYVPKTCGEHMMFNPTTNNCDWPAHLEKIKPFCLKTTEVPPLLHSTSDYCESGYILSECAYQCDRMCIDYLHTVQQMQICIGGSGQKCDSGCIPKTKPTECPLGHVWSNRDTCVPLHDCMCRSAHGEPVKPGSIVKVTECEVCQCIDNYYTCDNSACKQIPSASHEKEEEEREEYNVTHSSSTSEPHVTTSSTSTQTEHHMTLHVTPPKECHPDMYMDLIQNDATPLPDEAFNASGTLGNYFAPNNARIDSHVTDLSSGSWSPLVSDKTQWLDIRLPQQEPIYGIVIKGSPLYDQYVTSFKVLYSPDAVTPLQYVLDHLKQPQLFRGSMDGNTPVKHMFHLPIEAKIVRVNPQTWHSQIALRLELIGCGTIIATTTPLYEVATTVVTPAQECSDSMGLSEGLMAVEQITVSSARRNNPKSHLKLNGNEGPWHFWQPIINSPSEYILFNLMEPRNVTGFISKGGRHGWVTAFQVKYSHNKLVWNPILEDGQTEKVFPGNFDKDTPHENKFPLPIMATFIKVIPIKWMDNIQVRLELLGCYKPYPMIVEEVTVSTPTECNVCPGAQIGQMDDNSCHCKEDMWFDGTNCVSKPYCPCIVGHLTYPVGTSFVKEDCSDCICKLSGVPHCMPRVCDKCELGLRSVVSSTCTCLCLPCGDEEVLCPTTNICIPKASWCNGVQDCPDDEIDCVTQQAQHIVQNKTEMTSTHTVTHHEIKETMVQCAKITCPNGYKMIEKHLTPEQKKYMYIATMFSTHGSQSYTKPVYALNNRHKPVGSVNQGNMLDRPALLEKKIVCPEYTCIPKKPPPTVTKDKPCPAATCPDGYVPNFITEIGENTNCPTYECNPAPNRDSICNVTGKSFSTFDGTIYNYDICDHILARDLENGQWSVTLSKKCDKYCTNYLTIDHEEHVLKLYRDLSLEYDDFRYNVEQIKKIGSQSQAFSISKIGSMIVFVSNRYGVWIMWDKQGKVKIGVSSKLHEHVDGLCGFFNGNHEDDKRKPNGDEAKTTAEFGDSWSIKPGRDSCEPKACPDHIQNKALEMCKIAKTDVFSKCSNVINMDAFLAKCMDSTCTCLEATNNTQIGEDACRCQMLQNFVVDCMTSDSSIELMDWRTINDCPATCEGQLVHHDCYRRRCEPTCSTISDSNACPRVDSLCFPGCYCPPGLVRHGSTCVKASTCRDCECNVLPHLQYVTYDGGNVTVNGECVFVMSRDKLEKYHDTHKFQVLVTNGPCQDNALKMCVGKITILYDGHKIHIFYDAIRNNLKLMVDSERIDDFSEIADWSQIRQTKSKHFKILLQKIQVEVSVYFPSLGISVKAPSHKYGGKMEGLCGDCNKYAGDDMRMPDGQITHVADDFALSWLYDQLPGGQSKEQCGNTEELCEPLESDPCVQLLDSERYKQCHPVLSPGMFLEWCRKESCGGLPEGACNAVSAYGRECLNSGFCVHWHSDLCPAMKCPAEMEYKQCGPSCTPTCQSVLDKNILTGCVDVPTDGCFCPEGKVRLNNTCVEPAHCEVCDEYGHHNGDKWKQDACTECQCLGIALKCERQNCPAVDAVCDYGFTAIKLSAEPDQCCDKFICVPAATSSPTCDPPQKLTCGPDQLQKLETTPDGCQRFICQCKPAEECEPVSEEAAPTDIIEPGMVRLIEHGGCCPAVKYECKIETCPKSAECIEFYTLKKIEARTGDCCPRYECMPPEEQCIVELEYTQEDEGGERERTTYERQKLLKKVNSTWHDGPCRDCHCIETLSGSFHPTCVTTECPALAHNPDVAEYVITAYPQSGQCCADLKRTACRHSDGVVYHIGDTWSTKDVCTEIQCVKTEKGVQKQTHVQQCDKHCELGWEYVPSERECCGSCKQVSCVVDGQVRNVGEKWSSDDHCTKYECIHKNGSMQTQSEVITCDEISADKLANFLYKVLSIPGECCPKHEMIACREGTFQYQIGEIWSSVDLNPCKTTTCVDQYGTLSKQDTIQSCASDCAPGHAYFPPTNQKECCGRCEPIACVLEINGTETVKQPAETWLSSDECTTYSCDPLGEHLFTVTSQQESCPDVSDCVKEQRYWKNCCERCNITAHDLSQCLPQEMAAIKSIGIIKIKDVSHGLCLNAEPIGNFTECIGTCHSSTLFNIKSGEHESICNCCQASEYNPVPVQLVCPDGHKFTDYVSVPSRCSCEGCAAQKQAINPFAIQARSLNSRR